mmetsp:Transcript_5391/g.22882  ORF Transcript_5391/g.22882 Transcript_5391/m.22882 type:complete len:91 (+) Transcript_5391:1999-2271(+)
MMLCMDYPGMVREVRDGLVVAHSLEHLCCTRRSTDLFRLALSFLLLGLVVVDKVELLQPNDFLRIVIRKDVTGNSQVDVNTGISRTYTPN